MTYCEHCDREFAYDYVYQQHKEKVHEGERGDISDGYCPNCEAHFKRQSELAQHHRKQHFSGLPIHNDQCPTCGLRFEDAWSMRTHHKHVHDESVRPKSRCKNCGEQFSHSPSSEKYQGSTFCSPECGYEYGRGGKGIEKVRRILTEEGTHWEEIAYEVREQADGQCEMCGEERESHARGTGLQVHHVIPMRSGGTHADWNLWALCPSCHGKAEAKALEHFEIYLWKGTPAPTERQRNKRGQFVETD